MPSVSVVVPIYNVEEYLPECVESILGQTLCDIEVVLVDDGSTDGCGALADRYALADRRVRVVHQANAGPGPARNSGIEAASGEYVGFVDGDDWVEPGMFEDLWLAAGESGADIAVGGHCDVSGGVKTYVKPHPLAGRVVEGGAIAPVRQNLYGHRPGDGAVESFPMSVCASIYRRSMVGAGRLRFREVRSEDTLFNLDAYRAARAIAFTGAVGYCYRKDGQASFTQTLSEGKLERFEEFIAALAEEAGREPPGDRELCAARVRRTAADYARLYVGLIAQSGLPAHEQRSCARRLLGSGLLRRCEGLPLGELPPLQRAFHRQLLKGNVGAALAMSRLRLSLKRKGGRR